MSLPPDSPAAPNPVADASAPPETGRPRRLLGRRLAAAGLAIALVAGGATAVAVAQSSAPAELPALGEGNQPPKPPAPTTTVTTAAPAPPPAPVEVTAAPVAVSAPTTPPKDALVRIGEIHIPKLGLVHPIYEGVELKVVDRGPGHWPGSALPGEFGNAVFAGHRTTHSRPFRRLHELVPGDEIIFRTELGEFTYHMTRQEIVYPTDTWIIDPTDDATVTLFACHPPGSARQRIVVRGSFRKASPLPPGATPLG